MAVLLDGLRWVGSGEQVTVLAGRAVMQALLHNPYRVAALLNGLRLVGAGEQAVVLAGRAVGQVPLDDLRGAAVLLERLQLPPVGLGQLPERLSIPCPRA